MKIIRNCGRSVKGLLQQGYEHILTLKRGKKKKKKKLRARGILSKSPFKFTSVITQINKDKFPKVNTI